MGSWREKAEPNEPNSDMNEQSDEHSYFDLYPGGPASDMFDAKLCGPIFKHVLPPEGGGSFSKQHINNNAYNRN